MNSSLAYLLTDSQVCSLFYFAVEQGMILVPLYMYRMMSGVIHVP